MLIHKEKNALLLRLKDPNRVLTIIPKSRRVLHEGKEYVAVRHGSDEVRVLNNLGILAPPPILSQYSWPINGGIKPFDAQLTTAAFFTLHDRLFCLNEMGTGKTLASLWGYDFLRSEGILHRALVVSTLSSLESTWADEISNHLPHLRVSVVHGSRAQRMKALAVDADIYIINHDGLKVPGMVEALGKRPDIDLILIDEIAQAVRNSGTDRFKAFNIVCNRQVPRKVWGMTGSPVPEAPTDAWAQCRITNPANSDKYFSHFRERVMRRVGPFAWVPREDAQDVVYQSMQPAIRFKRDECFDLPECIYESKDVALSDEQAKAYKQMTAQLIAEVAEGKITALNEAAKGIKLLQIACAVAYGDTGEEVVMDATPRMNVLLETIEQAATKTIVFAPFVAVVKHVAAFLRRKGVACECIYGEVSKSERSRIFGEFQHGPHLRVIVAQPSAMAHSLTLTAASTIIWYAPVIVNETFEQANARITRAGQKHTQFIVMLSGTEIERRWYQRLKNKQKVQGVLLDMVQGSRKKSAASLFL
jgi:SNF2 family DNA or RNA helicase